MNAIVVKNVVANDNALKFKPYDCEWPCDVCGTDLEAACLPSADYDGSIAEAIGCALCEACGRILTDLPFEEAVATVEVAWRARGHVEAADRLHRNLLGAAPSGKRAKVLKLRDLASSARKIGSKHEAIAAEAAATQIERRE